MKLTAQHLRDAGACEEVETFEEWYPEGVEPTEEECRMVAHNFDFQWAGEALLSRQEQERFHAARSEAARVRNDAVKPTMNAWRANNLTRLSVEYTAYWDAYEEASTAYRVKLAELFAAGWAADHPVGAESSPVT